LERREESEVIGEDFFPGGMKNYDWSIRRKAVIPSLIKQWLSIFFIFVFYAF
jgi:hypothetical protein